MFKQSTQYLQIKFQISDMFHILSFIYIYIIYVCLKTYLANKKNMEFYIFIMIEPYTVQYVHHLDILN